jgi:protein-tyrosine phosphatase
VMRRDPTSFVDIHSHLVPGVDDGARTVGETLDSVERMTREGIRKIVTTPHLDGSLTRNWPLMIRRLDEVTEEFERAAEAVAGSFPEVEFRRGHEVMLDVPDPDLSDHRLRLAGSRFVLVEWPRLHLPPGTPKVLERLVNAGVRPVVAHPERYIGIDLDVAWSWREAGAFLQVNYGTFLGRYGTAAETLAIRLLRRGWVDYLASDYHGRGGQGVSRGAACQKIIDLGGERVLKYLCRTNPQRILYDELPVAVPPLIPERNFWTRVKEVFHPEAE